MDAHDRTNVAAGLALRDVGEFAAREVRAVARPGTVEANASRRTLYPYSTGRNWGLGSRKPSRPTDALVDLRRLAAIRELDRVRGFAVIEPGVTQQALARALHDTDWTFNVTGSCADTSVLGNALERGVGIITSAPSTSRVWRWSSAPARRSGSVATGPPGARNSTTRTASGPISCR